MASDNTDLFYKKIKGTERLLAAICIALPGMLIDAVVLLVFDDMFPNLSAVLDRYFASWLLWACSLFVMTGFTKATFVRKNYSFVKLKDLTILA
ncbi:DUF5367 family protein [Lysinibacillus sp. Ag94]|uniref:DUF5367 family protein n=1 Tax=Lysinibacillus sp. Ag94 TaxID=2936682 RepID=UPI00200C2FC5|nr:DUF5367 family protein [Lysinibacillus sp. Ag94]UPW84870.1 DUF5367 domain-containing protein [Lysinibacillus sp. Ag94]